MAAEPPPMTIGSYLQGKANGGLALGVVAPLLSTVVNVLWDGLVGDADARRHGPFVERFAQHREP